MDIFDEWRSGASEITWRSTTAANNEAEVTIFTRRCGTPGAPALVCVHGFPTSSIDYFALTHELGDEFDIFLLDFPGYGLSDKPPAPYVYSLYDDARLLIHAITDVWQLQQYTMLTHDRGTSVGMIALSMFATQHHANAPTEVILTNANIYLPLANLTAFQTALLNPETARSTAAATTPELLAAGLGASTFMPRRTLDDPEVVRVEKSGRVRLRIINGSSGTNYFVDLGSLTGELIATDGMPVQPIRGPGPGRRCCPGRPAPPPARRRGRSDLRSSACSAR